MREKVIASLPKQGAAAVIVMRRKNVVLHLEKLVKRHAQNCSNDTEGKQRVWETPNKAIDGKVTGVWLYSLCLLSVEKTERVPLPMLATCSKQRKDRKGMEWNGMEMKT